MTAIGCSSKPMHTPDVRLRTPITADTSVVHAFDTEIESRLVDRLELDHFLRERNIHVHVADGVVRITGDVWTSLEKERVGDMVRRLAGVLDVANDLAVRPPR